MSIWTQLGIKQPERNLLPSNMKVLIVNGFSRSAEGLRVFQRFESTVRNVSGTQAFKQQKCFSHDEVEFHVVDYNSLDTFLHETSSGYAAKDAEKLFDHVDMVFIDGDATILPWFPRARKFLILLRMCKRTGKVLFACSFAMQMFTFLCATRIFISRIVNGNGRGSGLSQFQKVSKRELMRLDHGEMFLHSATGDLYDYDTAKGEFYPVANVSLHNHKAAQEDAKARTTILKSYRYVAQNFDDPDHLCTTQTETSCRVLKQYVQHWLSVGLGVSTT